jgi:hypothetical protein
MHGGAERFSEGANQFVHAAYLNESYYPLDPAGEFALLTFEPYSALIQVPECYTLMNMSLPVSPGNESALKAVVIQPNTESESWISMASSLDNDSSKLRRIIHR